MPSRRYRFVTIDMVERSFAEAIAEFFRNYPDPVPDYQYLDRERGRGLLESALAEPTANFRRAVPAPHDIPQGRRAVAFRNLQPPIRRWQ